MLRKKDRNRPAEMKHKCAASSFDYWLERDQRRGSVAPISGVERGSYARGDRGGHVDPRYIGGTSLGHYSSHTALPSPSAPPALFLPGQQCRLEQLEELLRIQSNYYQLLLSVAAREGVGCDVPDAVEVASTSHPLVMPHSGAALLCPYSAIADSLCSAADGADKSGGRPSLIEPYSFTQELSRNARPSGGSNPTALISSAAEAQAERYIARLEEEVQTLMVEICDKDLCIIAMSAAKDAMALQAQEQQKRGELIGDEGTTRLMLSCNHLRTVMFLRTREASTRAMELNTQIALLQHELKLAEALLAQSQNSAIAAAAPQQQQQPLKARDEEETLTRAVSNTLRSLLRDEYGRLAQLVAEMPKKVQTMMSTSRSLPRSENNDAARDATAPQERQLYEPLHSELASLDGVTGSLVGATVPAASASASSASPQPPALDDAETAHLARLVFSVCRHHEAMSDLYCAVADEKTGLAQYEVDIVRLINAKQSALTWATLYEDKKHEAKHLHETIMSLRGELRTAKGQQQRFVGSCPSADNTVGSTIRRQSYEAYAAPYVPPTAQLPRRSRIRPEGPSASTRRKPRTAAAIMRPITELREEARRLGVLPALHYPPLVTSPSPSTSFVSALSSPAHKEQRLPVHGQQDVARTKSGAHAQAAEVSTVVQVPSVVTGASVTCSVVASVIRKLPRQRERAGASSPPKSPPHSLAMLPDTARPLQSRARDSSQRAEATSEPSIPQPAVSRCLSSSSSTGEALPAACSMKVAPFKREFGAAGEHVNRSASSSSVSFGSSLSHTKAQWTASMPTAVAAKEQSELKTAHNSFDDSDDDESREGAVVIQKGTLKGSHRLSGSKLAAPKTSAKPTVSGKTTSRAAAAAVAFDRKSKPKGIVDVDDDTSSTSLSMLSLSSEPPKSTPGGIITSADNAKQKSWCGAATFSHMRKSSFDEGDNTSSSSSSTNSTSVTPLRAKHAKLGSNTVRTFTAAAKPSAAKRPLSATTTILPTAKSREATSTPSTAKPTTLKLPTW
ncbi:hypothetical protein LSCM1_04987 [Leishmania martiniquensis]|uniref:Ppg3-related protein-like protein n=1 Tax=Leishmania martiniquensis TaxID=1580590 RepID=A0A836HA22_9TRYP|nr:hypothetical protein LSCM1_04987 [Leishmania martiniquensis]